MREEFQASGHCVAALCSLMRGSLSFSDVKPFVLLLSCVEGGLHCVGLCATADAAANAQGPI